MDILFSIILSIAIGMMIGIFLRDREVKKEKPNA